jgi:cytidylate kinase
MSPVDSTRPAPVIAIDGPAGAGKSTLARALARELGLPYVNTGLMYRAVASRALAREVDPGDEATLADIAARMRFDLGQGDVPEILIDGSVPDASLATPGVESIVSAVARHPAVRGVLRERQRALGEGGAVMEGRDIGTVVFPDADVKIFLSADPGVRAGRRVRERRARKADRVAKAVAQRDALDRRTNPLEPAPDAHVLDSTRLSREEMLAEALRIVREALAGRPA